jgi:hypothetical protein
MLGWFELSWALGASSSTGHAACRGSRGPSRQNSLTSCSTGKDAAISDGAGMGSIGVGVAVEVKAPPRPPRWVNGFLD